uniref:non-specific serine/threonine protein kinase n=1 Tax=Oplegnathus fasciatus TaxID=163134 RepID=B7TCB0_OPLFA|nr:double-stranded RNA-dependent protein kinase [Oplegnathus fasciatus]
METGNYIARLNEFAQRTRSALKYNDLGCVGPDHIKTFTQRVVLNGKAYPDGVGKNKREAKHNAAKNALKCLLENEHEDSIDSTENSAEAPPTPDCQTRVSNINYICWLNEYGQKNRVTIRAVESTRPGPNNATLCCSFVVGGREYPTVTGETKREAKEEAAKLVYDVICGRKTTETADEKHNRSSGQQKEELNQNVLDICNETRRLSVNSKDNSFTETNYIGLVNHYCQKTNGSHKFIEERRCGPPHNPRFFYKLVINDKDYPVGEGKSAKEAKKNAAQLAWSALQEQSDWDSKVSVRSVSEDDAPPELSEPSTSLESHGSSSQSTSVSTCGSIIFTDSSNPSKAQMPFRSAASGDNAPTSLESLASSQSRPVDTPSSGIFTDSSNSSEDQDAVKGMNRGKTQTETLAQSRFTSDFYPMECLGSGAYGCVYKVKHKLLEKYYAVKIVCCEEKSLREVGTLSDLHHDNIVRYYTFWMEDSGYQWDISADSCSSSQSTDNPLAKFLYIQMELCDTKTLKHWIKKKNKTLQDSKRREESLSIAQQIVSGVEYIHSKKHIHRDLKPANILFGLDKVVKIGDFGLVTRDDDALMDRTVNKGTPTYMAPEQKSEKNYDRKVDIFPLGLIYFELLWKLSTGHERGEVLQNARCQKLPEEFSLTFPREKQIIQSMLCEKPEGRPEASTLKAELEKWAQTFKAQNMCQENATV